MSNTDILSDLKERLKGQFIGESTGHDWFHIERVRKLAVRISKIEGGDLFIVELGALFHDIADHKFVKNANAESIRLINKYLKDYSLSKETIQKVVNIVLACSFKGGENEHQLDSIEAEIVQDADRLDAIGAIGIARTFAFGGKFGNELYNPEVKPAVFESAEAYRKNRTHTVNHFYEKLLLLKDKMNTNTGKLMAEERHKYMESFLEQFYKEWEGNR